MRIVVDLGHPAHVHFFKNFIREMEEKGHQFLISASEKEVLTNLLNAYQFPFINMGSYGNTMFQKIRRVPVKDFALYKAAKPFKPDLFVSLGSIRAAHVAWLMRKPCLIFDDDEYSYPYYHWFTNSICAFSGFKLSGKKILKVPGYKELAYLHPNRFRPVTVVPANEKIVLLRFVSWTAFHDGGQHGFNLDYKRQLVKELGKYAKVYISSESSLTADLEPYKLSIPPQDMHAFLSGIDLLVSESGTMTTEAAVLGIPVVRCNSFVGDNDDGNFVQLEKNYQLVYNLSDPATAIEKALELIRTPGLKNIWQEKQRRLLTEKIDVTAFMVWLVENYPDSFNALKAAEPFEIGKKLPNNIPVREWVLADG